MKKIANCYFTKSDILIYILLLIVAISPLISKIFNSEVKGEDPYYYNSLFVEVGYQGSKQIYPISQDRLIDLKQGKIKIEIREKKVYVVESDCQDKICVKAGKIDKPGQIIVCMPNKLYIKVISKKEDEYDGISF